ncbi:MAG: hypothetical protein QME94_06440 [Anaerolineae bacterium]|nr:hypothetical protein [Anaerolineae bacterium]
MELTPRQRQFYEALVALCRASGRSVHYSAVAEALGVSPFSAYDMLKVLESKGVVGSEYVLDQSTPGPGRSAIVFHPRPRSTGLPQAPGQAPGPAPSGASAPAARLPGRPDAADEAEWTRVRERLLQRLAEVRDANGPEVLSDLLGRLSEYRSPLSYCSGVVAALLVNLQASGRDLISRRHLPVLLPSVEVGLGTLAGLSIGSSLARLRGTPLLESLLQSARRLQDTLASLSAESRHRLAEFVREALLALTALRA